MVGTVVIQPLELSPAEDEATVIIQGGESVFGVENTGYGGGKPTLGVLGR